MGSEDSGRDASLVISARRLRNGCLGAIRTRGTICHARGNQRSERLNSRRLKDVPERHLNAERIAHARHQLRGKQ